MSIILVKDKEIRWQQALTQLFVEFKGKTGNQPREGISRNKCTLFASKRETMCALQKAKGLIK